jgi:hypothetical protein
MWRQKRKYSWILRSIVQNEHYLEDQIMIAARVTDCGWNMKNKPLLDFCFIELEILFFMKIGSIFMVL